ncbi:hypothetical protein [Streptomyces sp. NPDC058872]|uniref:hypothetical protein n=1 Tax=Streptomyces sp. NPDC058872 TaxID=3346661 RepID=UPI0036B9FB2A
MGVDRLRPVTAALAAVALASVLTGCQGGSTSATPGRTSKPTSTSGVKKPTSGVKKTSKPVTAKPKAKKPDVDLPDPEPSDCVHTAPGPADIVPGEVAVYRVEEIPGVTGKVNLVVQQGAWACRGPFTPDARFVGTGEERRWPLDRAAYVTVTAPIVDGPERQQMGVQQLIGWIDAHPDSGLVFRYETGDDGAIRRLEEVFLS